MTPCILYYHNSKGFDIHSHAGFFASPVGGSGLAAESSDRPRAVGNWVKVVLRQVQGKLYCDKSSYGTPLHVSRSVRYQKHCLQADDCLPLPSQTITAAVE